VTTLATRLIAQLLHASESDGRRCRDCRSGAPAAALSSYRGSGHTDTIILGFLLEGDKYGYEISKLVSDRSGRIYELKEATLYSSLKRLEKSGHITSQGGRRRYYRITESGRALHRGNKENWEWSKQLLDTLP
jgi:PadR family transcriptional regulator PadR